MRPGATRFTFIDASDPHTSQRSKEESLSTARAHAARVAHRRRQHRSDAKTDDVVQPDSGKALNARDALADAVVQVTTLPSSPSSIVCAANGLEAPGGIDFPASVKTYFAAIIPYVQASCEGFNCRQIWSPDLLTYLSDENASHAVAAVMQAIHDAFTHPSSRPATKPTDVVLRHRALAIERIRINLGRSSDAQASVLMAILLLAVLESRRGNLPQRDLHRRALGKLILQRGGLDTLEEYVKSSILQFEFFWAIETGETAIESLGATASDSTRQLATAMISDELLQYLPLGFQALVKRKLLSKEAVHEIIRTYSIQQRKAGVPTKSTDDLIPSVKNSSTHRNYWEACPDLLADENGESTINALICLGLLLFNSLAYYELSIWDTRFLWTNRIRSVRNDLIKRLMQCRRKRTVTEELGLFWVFSITIGSCKMTGTAELSAEGRTLAVFAYSRFSEWMKYVEGFTILKDFLFDDGVCFDIAAVGPICKQKESTVSAKPDTKFPRAIEQNDAVDSSTKPATRTHQTLQADKATDVDDQEPSKNEGMRKDDA